MQKTQRLSRGVKKYIRRQKARIRKEISDTNLQKQAIQQLYESVKRLSK